MAEVQWIRLIVGMFDGNSFKRIKRAHIGGVLFRDKLTAVWFELLDLAGKSNANGYLIENNEIPYKSFEDIATILDREEEEIELCMNFFINEKMIEIVDDVYCLTNFVKYQNQDGLEKIREQTRKRVAEFRERKRLSQGNATCNVTVTQCNAIELDKDKDIDTTTITNIYLSYLQSEEHKLFERVRQNFKNCGYPCPANMVEDFIVYNNSRNWLGIGGESVLENLDRYVIRWCEGEKVRMEEQK